MHRRRQGKSTRLLTYLQLSIPTTDLVPTFNVLRADHQEAPVPSLSERAELLEVASIDTAATLLYTPIGHEQIVGLVWSRSQDSHSNRTSARPRREHV